MSQQVVVGKSIHPLDSCADTFTVMETYYIYIYMWLVYLIYVRVSPLNAVNISNSSIGIFKLVYSTPCSKEVVYGSLSIVRAIQPCKEHLGKAATSGLLVAHGQCEQCSSQDSFLAYWIHRVPMSVPCRCVLQILGVCRCSWNPCDVVWHEA